MPPSRWLRYRNLSAEELAALLRHVAGHVRPSFYRKATRGPKKPATAKSKYKNGGHASTQKLLLKRKE